MRNANSNLTYLTQKVQQSLQKKRKNATVSENQVRIALILMRENGKAPQALIVMIKYRIKIDDSSFRNELPIIGNGVITSDDEIAKIGYRKSGLKEFKKFIDSYGSGVAFRDLVYVIKCLR